MRQKTYKNIPQEKLSPDLPNKELIKDTTIPPPSGKDYAAVQKFYLKVPVNIRVLRYKIYIDYLNATNHIITRIPFLETIPLVREGNIQIFIK